jgi:hypothetical protein
MTKPILNCSRIMPRIRQRFTLVASKSLNALAQIPAIVRLHVHVDAVELRA